MTGESGPGSCLPYGDGRAATVAHRVRVSRCHTGGRSSRRRVTLPVTKCPVDETTVGRLAARGRLLGGRGHSGSWRVLGAGAMDKPWRVLLGKATSCPGGF